jgi:hypothetical protein
MKPEKILYKDGTFWEPSYPDDYSDGRAYADMFSAMTSYYLRQIVFVRGWIFRKWRRTGLTHETNSIDGYEILSEKEARKKYLFVVQAYSTVSNDRRSTQ